MCLYVFDFSCTVSAFDKTKTIAYKSTFNYFIMSISQRIDIIGINKLYFYILDGNFSDNKNNYVQEVNGQLRVTELSNALQTNLNLLSTKLGMGNNYFKFDNNVVSKTATEVISENSDLFRTIKKHEQVLESALTELIHAIARIGRQANIFTISDNNINIDFDDSIIVSKEQERLQDRQDMAVDVMSRVEYREKWYGEDEEIAKLKIAEVDNEKPENSSINFIDGEIN